MIIKERLRGLGLVEGGRLRGGGVAERGGGDSQVSEDILNVALLVDVEILTPKEKFQLTFRLLWKKKVNLMFSHRTYI